MFVALYYVLVSFFHLVFLLVSPLVLLRPRRRLSTIRRFLVPSVPGKIEFDYWIHACSVGEVTSLRVVVDSIPVDKMVCISVVSDAGYRTAVRMYGSRSGTRVFFLPFETFLPFTSLKCKVLLVFEVELWLMFFYVAKSRGFVIKLINARMSSRSFKSYSRLAWFYRRVLWHVDLVVTHGISDSYRFRFLGAKNVVTAVNMKLFNEVKVTANYHRQNRLTILAASTHGSGKGLISSFGWGPSEEEIILSSFVKFKESFLRNKPGSSPPLLIVCPRHDYRFDKVFDLLNSVEPTSRFTELKPDFKVATDVLLVDVIGELVNFYAIADIVILGGSFIPVGGHNPIECASFGTRLITGKYIYNQESLFSRVRNYKVVEDGNDLFDVLDSYESLEPSRIDTNASHATLGSVVSQILSFEVAGFKEDYVF